MADPKTAVVLCTFNGERYLREQLDSISVQTVAVDEIHVFDWGSNDSTLEILHQWNRDQAGSLPAARIISKSETPGAARSFLQALQDTVQVSSADLVFLCDQDDIWMNNKVESFLGIYAGDGFDIAYSDVEIADRNGALLLPSFYAAGSPYIRPVSGTSDALLFTNPVIGMTMCIRRDWLSSVRLTLGHYWIMHDWALCILCHLSGARLQFLNRPLVRYRQHDSNALGAAQARSIWGRVFRLRRHVGNIRLQLESVRKSAIQLQSGERGVRLLDRTSGRFRQARVAFAPFLRFRYRLALATALLAL